MSEKSYCTKCPLFVHGCNPNIIGKLGDFIKIFGKIPDILVLITGHFGLFKTPTLRLGEVCKTQTQSQTQRLNFAKTDFKSVRKTIFALGCNSKTWRFYKILWKDTGHFSPNNRTFRTFQNPDSQTWGSGYNSNTKPNTAIKNSKNTFQKCPKNHTEKP